MYAQLGPEDEAIVHQIDLFFCGLHALVHMAESAVSSLVEAEKALYVPYPRLHHA